jgi:DNA-binding SARP family transcriptional activator/predicted ATPase
MLQIYLLGAPTIVRDGNPVQGFVSHKAAALLYYLAATGQPHTRPALAALLWPDVADAQAKKNLRDVLSNLRRLFGGELTITRENVQFERLPHVAIDLPLLLATLESAQRSDTSSTFLRQVLEHYRGDFLAGFAVDQAEPFEIWLRDMREHLRQRVSQVLQHEIEAALARGDYQAGIEAATQLLTLEPWSEATHRQLMTLLAASGQRGAALAQYERCRAILAEELGVEPEPETVALYQRILARAEKPLHNLPVTGQLSSFVGRAQELAELQQLLSNQAGSGRIRLLTLLGLGGVGKTRLALEVGYQQLHRYFDGVYFVPLAALTVADANALAAAIAQAMGLTLHGKEAQTTTLLHYLRDKTLLLILDNFEQLLPPENAPAEVGAGNRVFHFLTELLQTAPDVQLLVTSRVRLQLQGEWLFPVQGMPVPPLLDTSQVEHFDAVQLFLQHARRVSPAFRPDAYEFQAIARICQAVAGLPLGIELAATWVQMLPCHEIAAELEQTLGFLHSSLHDIPERHRSLRAVFDYSWRWLSPADQTALTQLTIFRGSFDRRAAQQILGISLPQLMTLVNKSLLQTVSAGRYGLHELVRQFAAERISKRPSRFASATASITWSCSVPTPISSLAVSRTRQ